MPALLEPAAEDGPHLGLVGPEVAPDRALEAAEAAVVGAEKKWWPRRDYARNPYPATWSGLRYPNSGLLIGTAKGFEQLQPACLALALLSRRGLLRARAPVGVSPVRCA